MYSYVGAGFMLIRGGVLSDRDKWPREVVFPFNGAKWVLV